MTEFYCDECGFSDFNVDKDEDVILTCLHCGEMYRITNHIELWK